MTISHHIPADSFPLHDIPAENGAESLPSPAMCSLIVNADDWGRDVENTDRILECVSVGTVSSSSAMMFMADSERAAELARKHEVDCGLHLNFTTPFSDPGRPAQLALHQERIAAYLRGSRLAQAVYHPGLASSFKYVVVAQMEEYERVFGCTPGRIDGHHHMHLCANVMFGKLLPAGTSVRRNFSFRPGQKSGINRQYRKLIDRMLAKRHRLTDYFFSLPPMDPPGRLSEIFSIARRSIVELETHPVNPEEYKFLTSAEILRRADDLRIARSYDHPTWSKATNSAVDSRKK